MQHAVKRQVVNESTATEALKQLRLWYARTNCLVELSGLWHSGARERLVERDFCRQAPERLRRSSACYEDLAVFGRDFSFGNSELTRGCIEEHRPQLRRGIANLAAGGFNRQASDRCSLER